MSQLTTTSGSGGGQLWRFTVLIIIEMWGIPLAVCLYPNSYISKIKVHPLWPAQSRPIVVVSIALENKVKHSESAGLLGQGRSFPILPSISSTLLFSPSPLPPLGFLGNVKWWLLLCNCKMLTIPQNPPSPLHYLFSGYVLGSIVCLLVCLFISLFVRIITQKVMNGLQWNFMKGLGVVQESMIKFRGDLGLHRWVNEQNTYDSCKQWSRSFGQGLMN